MRALEVIDGGDPQLVQGALRAALSHDGPAVLPRDLAASLGDPAILRSPDLPAEVPAAVALVIETSGSSGLPKRVALSGDALLASAAASEGALGGAGQWLLALPTHYIAGVQVLVRSIAAGTEPLVLARGHFDAVAFAAASDRLEAPLAFTSLVPAQLARVIAAGERDPGVRRAAARFSAILVGGQALAPALHQRAVELGLRVVRTYGASETAGGCVYDGRPIGRTVARVHEGELELSGPSLAEGYLGDEELTRRSFRMADGVRWYRTSDAGTVVDGVVSVTGRVDNVIISGGVKVSLDRVERIVQGLPGFEQAVVAPQPHPEWGQVAVVVVEEAAVEDAVVESAGAGSDAVEDPGVENAVVVEGTIAAGVMPGAAADGSWAVSAERLDDVLLREVREAVSAEVGRAGAPAAVLVVARLPRLSSGKPDRVAVARALAGADAEAGAGGSPAAGRSSGGDR